MKHTLTINNKNTTEHIIHPDHQEVPLTIKPLPHNVAYQIQDTPIHTTTTQTLQENTIQQIRQKKQAHKTQDNTNHHTRHKTHPQDKNRNNQRKPPNHHTPNNTRKTHTYTTTNTKNTYTPDKQANTQKKQYTIP